MSDAKKIYTGGGGGGRKEHNFLSEIWLQQRVFQLNVTRIAGR